METKSIEQLENDIWEKPSKFPTDLVEKCYRYRKISIAELTNEQIRFLISQQIGTKYLIGITLEKLEQNILTKPMNKKENIEIEEDSFEINATEKDSVIIQRHFTKNTKLDLEIQNSPIPKKPLWLNIMVQTLRFYQNNISEKLGNRCVFDPSCSRYSELAFREKGFFKGMSLTINRLKRCRPENGGIDQLN